MAAARQSQPDQSVTNYMLKIKGSESLIRQVVPLNPMDCFSAGLKGTGEHPTIGRR
jgi:hypothetical protein